MNKYLLGVLMVFVVLAIGTLSDAQTADRNEGKTSVEGKSGDSTFNMQIQRDRSDSGEAARRSPDADRGTTGPRGEPGPQGAPGPQGPSGPSGGFLGMDPTVALLVGLGILAVVIVAIVAASRGRREI
ncbi:MAG TPA: hypothetical protein VHM64_04135 [Candidatus Binatia bacterium]|nr:hypothetical protein [Candidatus Binatia bacterium]